MSRITSLSEGRLDAIFETLQGELESFPSRSLSQVFARDRLVQRMRKRAVYVDPELSSKAIETFLNNNRSVRSPMIEPKVLANARYYITVMLERYTSTFDEEAIQTPLNPAYLFDHWRFGPGSSNGVTGTHTAEKIIQSMTCTLCCVPYVRSLRFCNPYFRLFDESNENCGYTVVEGSRLATVPKNQDTERTIAVEPSGNMAMQLAAGSYLEGVLRYIGLDISEQQPKNKAAAKRGSEEDSLATIDLSSASDMISIDLVRQLFPRDWFRLLMAIRSPRMKLPNGESISLNMISTMGNGFTFPLMTLIIAALIYAYRACHGGPNLFIDWKDTCVFGDDIIIPKHEFQGICELLTQAGLNVNYDKSFCSGPFRESCGGDYYEGVDVTPFYIKSLADDPSVYVVINQVLEWGARCNMHLYRTLKQLVDLIDGKVHLVPEWLNPNQGILTSLVSTRYKYLSLVPYRRRLRSSVFDMSLAVGGYVEQLGPNLFFLPRSERIKVVVRRARLPHGFLDGRDVRKRTTTLSLSISLVVEMVMA